MTMMNNRPDHDDLCVGIDLGTTNSVLATVNVKPNGDIVSKVCDIPRPVDIYSTVSAKAKLSTAKKATLPSCVYYREENNYEPLVGDFAKNQYQLRPHLVAKSIKSQMGRKQASGLSDDIPDKTPAEISARILKHLVKSAANIYRCDITDAVITVPANFDSAMCKATRDAAEMAGIRVKNEDGSERPVLLSEPNAVIYDLINQIRNGEISGHILDLSEKKNVLVFDLGGGTLDITMHEIKRREDFPEVLKVNEIATNRYTLLGGDDFDEKIAEAMYERYLKQFAGYPSVAAKLRQEKRVIMPQLRVYAEHLKLDLNERCSGDYSSDYSSGWDDEDDEICITTGGNMGGIGYSYDDTFTKEEVETILDDFMARDLQFEDYKRVERIKNTNNIIYPILDVLKKAAERLGEDRVVVDAVLVNGGMSKFYMVTDRLKDFFGFDPIVALDPDQAVARGAAVYHYYLHKYEELQDDMRTVQNVPSSIIGIEWGRNILNDSLYLGTKNGSVHQIIPTGTELPYTSNAMTGFRLEPGQRTIAVPIKSRNLDGSYRTIAKGQIRFTKTYTDGANVSLSVSMESSKTITMKAWALVQGDGVQKMEECSVEISIDNGETCNVKDKILAPMGSQLEVKAEINNVLQLCRNYEKGRNKAEKTKLAKRLKACVNNICMAGNKEAFAEPVLDALDKSFSEVEKQRLFTIAAETCACWTETQKKRLARACMCQLGVAMQGIDVTESRFYTDMNAKRALEICGTEEQKKKVEGLHKNSRYMANIAG